MIELGDVVRDTITGFTGVVVAITKWLNNCERVMVQPRELHEGKIQPSEQFDVTQVELVSKKVIAEKVNKTGGPCPTPKPY